MILQYTLSKDTLRLKFKASRAYLKPEPNLPHSYKKGNRLLC